MCRTAAAATNTLSPSLALCIIFCSNKRRIIKQAETNKKEGGGDRSLSCSLIQFPPLGQVSAVRECHMK
jgi:hypothetical protein